MTHRCSAYVTGSISTKATIATRVKRTAHTVVVVGQNTDVLIDMSVRWLIVTDVCAWVFFGVVIGWFQARQPAERLTGTGWFSHIRQWERHGRVYRRWAAIDAWKDLIPDAGTWFGGLSKRRLPAAVDGGMARFVAECQRAERTHMGQLVVLPVFALWNPWSAFLWNVAFAVVGNVPCWMIARYNRARIVGIMNRKAV